jgi:hypothetical protein
MIKRITYIALAFALLLLGYAPEAKAQIAITQTLTPEQIAARLQGVGISVTAVRIIRCSPAAQGGFDVINSAGEINAVGLGNSGIILSTGTLVVNPTTQVAAPASVALSTNLPNPISPEGTTELALFPVGATVNLDGDAQLQAIAGQPIFDVCHIEIDIIPEGNEIRFPFTFASEEYPTFVNSTFNDAFGFFITSNEPDGFNYTDVNLAVIPTTTTPVTINTINWGNVGGGVVSNPDFYYHNVNQSLGANIANPTLYPISPNGQFIAFNGLTRNLAAVTAVDPCKSYTIKLKIGDGGDGTLDSGVFIERIQSDLLEIDVPLTSWDGCGDIEYAVSRPLADGNTIAYGVDYSGSAVANGVIDPAALPSNFSITNDGSFSFTIEPDYNLINPTAGDTLIIRLIGDSNCPGLPSVLYDSSAIIILPPVNIGADQIACINFAEPVSFFANYYYYGVYTWTVTGANPQVSNDINFTYTPTNPGVDVVTLQVDNGSGCIDTDEAIVQVFGSTVPLSIGDDRLLGVGEQALLEANQVYTSYLWQDVSGAVPVTLTTDSVFVFNALAPGIYTIRLTVFAGFPTCETIDEVTVFVLGNVNLGADQMICSNESATLDVTDPLIPAGTEVSYQWFEDGVLIEDATTEIYNTPPYAAPTQSLLIKTYRVRRTATLTSGAANVSEDEVVITFYPTPVIGANDVELCDDDMVLLDATLVNEATANYALYTWYNAETYATNPIPLSTTAVLEAQLGSYVVEVTTDVCFEAKIVNVTCEEELPVGGGFNPYRITLQGTPGYRSAQLVWNAPAEDEQPVYYYEIFGFSGNSLSTRLGVTTEPNFAVTGLINGVRYQFAVRAVYKNRNNVEYRTAFSNVVTIVPSVVLGTDEEVLNETFTVFPNPNNGNFAIKWESHLGAQAEVMVLNTAGKTVHTQANLQSGQEIALNQVPNGLYIVVVKMGDTVLKQKVSIIR